jgi:mannose-binding lectin 1
MQKLLVVLSVSCLENSLAHGFYVGRTLTQEVHSRSDSILQNQARQPTAQVQSVGYDMASVISEMRDGLNTVKRDVAAASQRLSSGGGGGVGGCPPQTACLSTTIFLLFAALQLAVILGYSLWR